jgi:hypothetical protein
MSNQYLTTEQVGKMLNVSIGRVCKLLQEGRLKGGKVTIKSVHRWWIDSQSVIANHRQARDRGTFRAIDPDRSPLGTEAMKYSPRTMWFLMGLRCSTSGGF